MSASGHGGDDGQLVAILDRRVQVLEVSDVLVIEIDVDEAARCARFLERAVGNSGKLPTEVLENGLDGGSGRRYLRLAAGVLPHRRRHIDLDRHEISSLSTPPSSPSPDAPARNTGFLAGA